MKHLLDLGLATDDRTHKQRTPLHYCARHGSYESAVALMEVPGRRQLVNAEDANGRSAFGE